MTISVSEIAAKVLARIEADTGSGGLRNASSPLVTAAYWDLAPESATTPYLSFDVEIAPSGGEHFKGNAVAAQIKIDAIVQRWMSASNGMDRMSAILARLYGDSGANSGVPGFGFHRWLMSGLTGWTPTHAGFLGQNSSSDDSRLIVTTAFEIKAISQTW